MKPLRRALSVVLMSVLLAACGTPRAPDAAVEPSPRSPAAATPSPTPSDVPTASPTATPVPIAENPPPLALEVVASGFDAPINIAVTPDGWLLVNERPGRIIAVDPGSGETSVALDLTDRVLGRGELGLLGLALHPDWRENGRAFVHYSDRNGGTVLSELNALTTTPPVFDPSSEQVLLQEPQPFANHNGGQLAFGPDGHLYLGLGDGGSAGDPAGNGQNPQTLLGAILRLDVSQPGSYAIPADNPFADDPAGRAEVLLFGLRNPWRFSFDPATGQLWIADVGQNAYEEVDRVDPVADAGANLGWNVMEASHCFTDPACSSEGLLLPVAEYGRDLGCSITGDHVYRGRAIPNLTGWYVAGDYCRGLLFGVRSDTTGEVTVPRVLLETGAAISAFGEGPDGELYLANLNAGTIYRIVGG
ncbi:MAG TPA: PQQ-dependent sugar dehydrogenase [Candidatus Binatia bacterium]|nr:PQQ-dependent sugar dehydrogenase [Candidatus Binatia bacterium]